MQNNLTDSTDNLLSTGANNVGQTKKRQSYHHRANKPAQKVLSANTPATNLKPNPVASQKPLRNNRTQAPKQNQTNRLSTARPQRTFVPKTSSPLRSSASQNKLRIIPLGGCEEVGRNMTIFEYNQDIIILDMGLQFPEEDMPGIDYIIPNTEYLKGKEKNIRAVIFSHGHLDHIGASPILLEKLGYPLIVGRPLTLAMVKHKVEDYKKHDAKNLKTLMVQSLNDQFKFGNFTLKFFQMEHSIMDAVGVTLETPQGTVIHPGDWTLERDNNNRPILDYTHLSKLKSPRILMLESLGAIDVRPSASHETMKKNLEKLISEAPGRVIIGTFSSQIERISWIISQAEKLGKKVALDGYSMKMNIEIAKELGYIKTQKHTFIKIEEANGYPDNKLVIIATGAQGEGNAVLSRIITGAHRNIKIKKNDTVVLSSSIIPGNENTIQRLKDGLYRQCDNVIHGELMDIHVSGHGNRQDIVHMLQSIKPDYYIPVYAYYYMLKESGKIAKELKMAENHIIVPNDGSVIEFDQRGGFLSKETVNTDYVFVDGLGVGDVSNVVLRDRQMMSGEGMLVVIATMSRKDGKLLSSPDIISRGFIYMKENKEIVEDVRNQVKKIINDHNKTGQKMATDSEMIKEKLRNNVGQFLFQKTKRRPMILPVVIEV